MEEEEDEGNKQVEEQKSRKVSLAQETTHR